jgi:PAS domain S-box-containing protein
MIRILHLEDSPEDAQLIESALVQDGFTCEIVRVESRAAFLEALAGPPFHLILSDYALPAFDGILALGYAREMHPDVPFLFVSGTMGEELAIEMLKAGATDYVLKDRLSRLGTSVRRALGEAEQKRQRRRAETERELQESALRESEGRFRMLADSAPVMIWLSDIDGRCTFFNKQWLDFRGRTLEEEIGAGWEEGVHPEDLERCRERHRRATFARERFQLEFRLRGGDGACRWVLETAIPRFGPRGEFAGYIGSCVDITARREAEGALRASEAKYRSIVETTNEWIWAVDLEGRWTYSNRAVEKILGYAPEELVGKETLGYVHPEDAAAARERLRDAIAQGAGWNGVVLRWRHRNGSVRQLESNATPVAGAGGELQGFRGADRDITERMHLEAQLRHSQKMEAIGTLAGGIAHDFNNLLTTILGYTDLALERVDEEELREDLEQIQKAGERAAVLTRQLLAFSRKQVVSPVVLDVNEVVRELEKMLGRLIGEDVELVTSLDPELGKVRADPGQIEQIIVNLVVNARDAMPDGGRLTIETGNVDPSHSPGWGPPNAPPGRGVCLVVRDTGTGMDSETQSHIFEPFFTTKPAGKGTGLGLSTVYGIVNQSEGHVLVESETGRGTTFRIFLPRVDEPASGLSAHARGAPSGGRETILLVEDEEPLRALGRRVLEKEGYTLLEASSAEAAIAAARARPGEIALMVTDAIMPGMSGPDLARLLASSHPAMKVLFISGYTDDEIVRKGVFQASEEFLQKPFTPLELAKKVRQVLDGARAGAEPDGLRSQGSRAAPLR